VRPVELANRAALVGRVFFGVSLVAWGIQQFLYGDFVPGRAPAWPSPMPGRLVWAYLSGALLVAAGAAIVSGRRARWAAIASAAMIFVWALLRHIPLAAADPSIGGAWTNAGKALTFVGGALAVAGSLRAEDGRRSVLRALFVSKAGLIVVGRLCLGAFMILCGIQHFMFAQFVMSLVPAWIPGPLFWTYFAGVALIAGGAGLFFPPTARLAAALSALMVFLWVVTLHIPRALAAATADQSRNEWTAVFEALAVSGIALMLSGAFVTGSSSERQGPAR
jgi:uncharacterized membrane protein YphA (DoxX/SURF4 family)